MAAVAAHPPIVFIHGLWMHSSTWEPWMQFFKEKGYESVNPPWPGDSATVAETRKNADAVAGYGIKAVADSYAAAIAKLKAPPILIGHSFGGLLVQELLGRGIAAAGIAIDPAPIKGVWQLPISALRASLPVLGNPMNRKKAVALTLPQFTYAFANALPEAEAAELFERCTIPSPGLPLFQVAFASLNPKAENKVDAANATRGPLLLTSGDQDHTVPPVLVKSALKRYAGSSAVTELKSFSGRGHSLTIDHGWSEIAGFCAEWLAKQGL